MSRDIADIFNELERRVNKAVNDILPRKVGVIAVKHFNQNFRQGGFTNGGVHPWKVTRRQLEGKGADARRRPLISAAPHLSRSNQAIPGRGEVTITNPVPYASIHNDGGTINTHPKVTPKMRKMAWAKVYAIAGTDNNGKLPKDLPEAARKWKALALTKKSQLNIVADIPQRQFIGESAELKAKINDTILKELEKIKKDVFNR